MILCLILVDTDVEVRQWSPKENNGRQQPWAFQRSLSASTTAWYAHLTSREADPEETKTSCSDG